MSKRTTYQEEFDRLNAKLQHQVNFTLDQPTFQALQALAALHQRSVKEELTLLVTDATMKESIRMNKEEK